MEIFIPLLKADSTSREVYGVMAEEVPDKAGEILDYLGSKPYVQQWSAERLAATGGKSYGNVRAQHSNIAAGKLVSIAFDDAGKKIPIVARIVDDAEWQKVVEGVYSGFSVGGSYVKKWPDGKYTRYVARPAEVSIVDNPAMYGATFSLVKANGASELRPFAGRNQQTAFVPRGVDRSGEVAETELARARRGGRLVTFGTGRN
jgi:hypothetical protein